MSFLDGCMTPIVKNWWVSSHPWHPCRSHPCTMYDNIMGVMRSLALKASNPPQPNNCAMIRYYHPADKIWIIQKFTNKIRNHQSFFRFWQRGDIAFTLQIDKVGVYIFAPGRAKLYMAPHYLFLGSTALELGLWASKNCSSMDTQAFEKFKNAVL